MSTLLYRCERHWIYPKDSGTSPPRARVYIKPNLGLWSPASNYPKWGVITTSRIIEDAVSILKEWGVEDIVIGEGLVLGTPNDMETPRRAFESLGYFELKKRYGVKPLNIFERPFREVDLGEGVVLNYNIDFLESDFVVNLPVLKTHGQAVVSLGIKNLKGMIDIPSRKKCHSPDPRKDLHFMISKLHNLLPPSWTLIDGIYSLEYGPFCEGGSRRTNLLAASTDILSVDMIGARILGIEPASVPHLVHAARAQGRPLDLSDIEILGEDIDTIGFEHEYSWPYNEQADLPLWMAEKGIRGLSFPKPGPTICTYCSRIVWVIRRAIAEAWKGEKWNEVEILIGKTAKGSPGKKKTILVGKCIYQANKNNFDIQEMIAVKGCPPSDEAIVKAFQKAGIEVNPELFENNNEMALNYFMEGYRNRPEFEDSFYRVQSSHQG